MMATFAEHTHNEPPHPHRVPSLVEFRNRSPTVRERGVDKRHFKQRVVYACRMLEFLKWKSFNNLWNRFKWQRILDMRSFPAQKREGMSACLCTLALQVCWLLKCYFIKVCIPLCRRYLMSNRKKKQVELNWIKF